MTKARNATSRDLANTGTRPSLAQQTCITNGRSVWQRIRLTANDPSAPTVRHVAMSSSSGPTSASPSWRWRAARRSVGTVTPRSATRSMSSKDPCASRCETLTRRFFSTVEHHGAPWHADVPTTSRTPRRRRPSSCSSRVSGPTTSYPSTDILAAWRLPLTGRPTRPTTMCESDTILRRDGRHDGRHGERALLVARVG
jgi:hypothetical protein